MIKCEYFSLFLKFHDNYLQPCYLNNTSPSLPPFFSLHQPHFSCFTSEASTQATPCLWCPLCDFLFPKLQSFANAISSSWRSLLPMWLSVYNLQLLCLVAQPCPTLLVTPWTVACQAPLSMGFPAKNTGVGCPFLLQGIFLTQGLNPALQVDSLLLSYQGSPYTLQYLLLKTWLNNSMGMVSMITSDCPLHTVEQKVKRN